MPNVTNGEPWPRPGTGSPVDGRMRTRPRPGTLSQMTQPPHRWSPICAPPARLVRPVRLDPRGETGPTRGQARGGRWRQTSRGWYVPATVDGTGPEQRIMEQSVRLPAGGAVTGWASARLHGANFFDGLEPDGRTLVPVPLVIGPAGSIRADPRVVLSRDRLTEAEVVTRYGVPCTRRERALFDAARCAEDVAEAVVALDMGAAAELSSLCRMGRYVAAHSGWAGAPQVRTALGLASEDSRSPNEARTRVIWMVDAGLPPPLVNKPLFDLDGRLLGIPDLLDTEAGMVGEFDGADHRAALRHSKDVAREDRFRKVGLEYVKITGPDLAHRDRVVDRILSTRRRARWLPESRRAWTVTPPPHWEIPPTLDEVLDLRDVMAEVYSAAELADR